MSIWLFLFISSCLFHFFLFRYSIILVSAAMLPNDNGYDAAPCAPTHGSGNTRPATAEHYIFIYIYIYIWKCMSVYIQWYKYIQTCTYIHTMYSHSRYQSYPILIYLYICIYSQLLCLPAVNIYIYTYIYIYKYALYTSIYLSLYIHIYIYIHI